MTYSPNMTHTGAASTADAEGAGAPGIEIEITAEMIEAGASTILMERDLSTAWDLAVEVYRAMELERKCSPGRHASLSPVEVQCRSFREPTVEPRSRPGRRLLPRYL